MQKRICELVALGNAHIHTDLIAGLPYEGYEDFQNSFDTAYSLGANMLQLGFLKILHGTELKARASEYGFSFSKEPPYEVYETPWLSQLDFEKLKLAENALDRLHNSGRFRRVLALVIPHFGRPYDFFYQCGSITKAHRSLDEMTDALYAFLCNRFPDMAEEIRDAFVCDRMATNSAKGMPKALYRKDARLAQIRRHLNTDVNTAEKNNVRRSIAILYHANAAVYCDYTEKDARGEYQLHCIPLARQNEKS